MTNTIKMIDDEGNEIDFNPQKIEDFKLEENVSRYVIYKDLYFFLSFKITGPKRKPYFLVEINLTPGTIPSDKNVIIYYFKYDLNKNILEILHKNKNETTIENIVILRTFIFENILSKIVDIKENSKGYKYINFDENGK